MFRDMFTFGKPFFFRMSARTSQYPVPQEFCELNLVGLRYLAIGFRYPLPGRGEYVDPQNDELFSIPRPKIYEKRMAGLMISARETESVLWKCRSLQKLRLVLQTRETCSRMNFSLWGGSEQPEYFTITEPDHLEMLELIDIFLNAASCKKFQTAAERDRGFVVPSIPTVSTDHRWKHITIDSYRDPLVHRYNSRAQELGFMGHVDTALEY